MHSSNPLNDLVMSEALSNEWNFEVDYVVVNIFYTLLKVINEGKAIEDQWIFFEAKFCIMATKKKPCKLS